jgi:hypothetical protein
MEMLIGAGLAVVLLGLVVELLRHGSRSTHGLTARMSLQQESRKAIVRFLKEVQQGMEVIRPVPGSTLSYALVRDKMSLVRWYYLVGKPASDPAAGPYELWRHLDDPAMAAGERAERLLDNVQRVTFTSTSEGALQLHVTLRESGTESAVLTTVRLRNLASAEQLW